MVSGTPDAPEFYALTVFIGCITIKAAYKTFVYYPFHVSMKNCSLEKKFKERKASVGLDTSHVSSYEQYAKTVSFTE